MFKNLLFLLTLCLSLGIMNPAGAAQQTILEDNFRGVMTVLPDGTKRLYPDTRLWSFTFWPGVRWPDSYGDGTNWLAGNDECQTYVTAKMTKVKRTPIAAELRYDPFRIARDGLHIKADLLTPEQQAAYKVGSYRRFGSGLLKSNLSFRYGKITLVAKLPSARGSWPAFWLLSARNQWPPEIDVFEAMAWGKHAEELHSGLIVPRGQQGNFGDWFDVGVDLSEDFHEYSLNWTEDTITMSFDGKKLWTRPTPDGLKEDMYLLINLAVGGKWVFNELGVRPIDGRSVERLEKGASLIEPDYPAEMIIRSVSVVQEK